MSGRETRNVRFGTPDWYALPQQGWRTIHMSFPHLSEDDDRLRTAVFIMEAPETPTIADSPSLPPTEPPKGA